MTQGAEEELSKAGCSVTVRARFKAGSERAVSSCRASAAPRTPALCCTPPGLLSFPQLRMEQNHPESGWVKGDTSVPQVAELQPC